ncbi:hypothetical protein CPB86DRAFT_788989 [Serendipita vermifera]|nr:hypothetical protein CPB86DRAFT_788989 [Serendipita vermifera]
MNHYDRQTGEITSSDAAMYDAQANISSFSRKGTPSKAAIPTSIEQSIFCHECTVNQTLVTNMLANYLPLPSDPNYEALLATLPEYRASLETRYPIVCERCAPLVEEKLLKKERMAKSKALGGWLDANTKQRITSRRPSAPARNGSIVKQQREKPWQVRLWMLQGLFYASSTVWVAVSYIYGMSKARAPPIRPPHPILVISSLLWTFWNRAWLQVRRAQSRGLSKRITGRKESMRIQFVIWLSRLSMSVLVSLWGSKVTEGTYGSFLAVEVAFGLLAMITLKVVEPPPIILSRHSSTAVKKAPVKPRSSLMPSESFIASTPKPEVPTFGAPSLVSRASTTNTPGEEMDWTPQANLSLFEDDAFTLKPGRLGTAPTGLESLFAGTSFLGDSLNNSNNEEPPSRSRRSPFPLSWIQQQDLLIMGGVIVTIMVLLLGTILPAWQYQKGGLWDPSWDWSHFENKASSGGAPTPSASLDYQAGSDEI